MATPPEDVPHYFFEYAKENERQHAELGRRIAESENRLLWRMLVGMAAIVGLATWLDRVIGG